MTTQHTHYRTIWISDLHLGSKGCNAEHLLNFLKHTDSDYLFLVGDIIDCWALSRNIYWPTTHNTIIQKILKKARHGTKVIFIPGNHDENIRQYVGLSFGDIEIHENYTHTLLDGTRIFCVHGDLYDVVTRCHRWLAIVGDVGYEFLLWANRIQNRIRSTLGLGHWSLSAFIKNKVKEAVNFISDYQSTVVKEAVSLGVDGVLCGHIHHAKIEAMGDITYYNTGDWVESCTSIVEKTDGTIELINWLEKV